ncbi:TPA: phage tail protein [Escherichia coli]|uniref:phage tail-collar fiber domain-containing protein n=1 Tax=Escherichia coli TaxID=562 RepID=UPI001DBD7621|nr:phage tail protein [Escherichia coli]EET2982433.1 phage tail protein [Escherichia coli]EKF0507706.1 phage tail protein [Escherichia coli]EKF0517830.1 phage tail protein [Escherichia coli]ELJ2060332.1 phage tail protein [Escherichia coli]MDZ4968333.1 phage tail protein [Escherichia coli]
MTVKYYAILTNQGAARLANATMLGSKLNLTQMAVGDANGVLPTPDPAQTKLINQKRIAPLNLLSVDPNNQSQIIAEQIIPENEGGFWIREIGLYDDEGVLIAVANCPETYKPQLQEGSGRTQTIRMILVVTNTEAITLKIDPSVVLATRKYVDDEVLELRLYVDDQMRNHIAAQDPHTQYAQKHNPTFTGEPKAPTPDAGNNTTRIATTAFVQAAITALINGAPATLDTLKEIAAAINNDPKFSTTINNALSGKQPLDETLTHLSGKDVAGLLAYLGLGEGSALPVGVPVPWPSTTPPTGWLKCNGAAFSAEKYPELAKAYPTNKLPDLRGEFIRGWDDGRGVDAGRALLSLQDDSFEAHRHESFFYAGISRNETPLKNLPSSDEMLTLSSTTNALSPDGIDATNSLIGNDDYNCLIEGNKNNKRTATGLSTSIVGAAETRPRNISFNYIVRAA